MNYSIHYIYPNLCDCTCDGIKVENIMNISGNLN